MSDDRPVTGFDPPSGGPADDDARDDAEHDTEWNWPFIGAALALTVVVLAVAVFLTTRGDDAPPTTTTTTTVATTTTQLSAQLTVAELLPLDEQFATLEELAGDGEVAELLDDDGEWTLFAPSTEALDGVTLPDSQGARDELLRRHVVEGALSVGDLAELDGSTVTALSGDELTVLVGEDRRITVGGALVVKRQIVAGNGVIYVIDGVVSP